MCGGGRGAGKLSQVVDSARDELLPDLKGSSGV